MGDWTLVIQGTGPHHNQGSPRDADVLADEAVQVFLGMGQVIHSADFTSGGRLVLPVNPREGRWGADRVPETGSDGNG